MRLPELTPLKARREIINRFAGYNHRDVILDGANNDYASGAADCIRTCLISSTQTEQWGTLRRTRFA